MQKAKFTITVPTPCSENWDLMVPADKGRYCAACKKNVIDFSVLTDGEIIAVIKQAAGGQMCGNFHSAQLQRQYTEREPVMPLYRVWLQRAAAALLFFETISAAAWAQTTKPGKQAHAAAPVKKGNVKQIRAVSGTVTDYATREPLPGIVVQIKGTGLKTTTGKGGRYYLPLPDSFRQETFMLTTVNEVHTGLKGATIPAEEVTMDSVLLHRAISLYRYPVETLQVEKVTDTRVVMPEYFRTGGAVTVTTIKQMPPGVRRSWIRRLFQRKHRNDE